MPNLKIAYSPKVEQYFSTNRELVEITKTDFTDVAAIVLTSGDVGEYLERIQATN
ncbi:Orn/Lys/Arg decarboxylase N-terminal domain-containing protein, partial [Haemophilus sp. HMSC066D03]